MNAESDELLQEMEAHAVRLQSDSVRHEKTLASTKASRFDLNVQVPVLVADDLKIVRHDVNN